MLSVEFSDHSYQKTKAGAKPSAVIFAVSDSLKLPESAKVIDKKTLGAVTRAMETGRFKGKRGQVTTLVAPKDMPQSRIFLIGLGKEKELDTLAFEAIGGAAVASLNNFGVGSASFVAELPKAGKLSLSEAVAHIAYGAALRSYRFDKYFTKQKEEDKATLTALTFHLKEARQAARDFAPLKGIAESVFFSRDVVSEPPNVLYPASYAAKCKELVRLGVMVEVLGEKEMKKLGMGALLGVGQGSEFESKMVVMRWNGGGEKGKGPLAFVGKGVTFDTGGISIKPSANMEEMKYDMGGSAAVIGLMRALAARKAKVNAVGVVGLVENMPDGKAQRPGDVVVSMSKQTIEVINTDAEGRLVLADALWYTQTRFKPRFVINLATLTGAITVALGDCKAGLFSNDDKLAKQIFEAGERSGEEVWRMPLGPEYDKQIDSDIADMKNVGSGRGAGSTTAAQFLQRFIKDGTPWAHLDIAGVAWTKKALSTVPKGATGYGVRLLNQLVTEYYEKK